MARKQTVLPTMEDVDDDPNVTPETNKIAERYKCASIAKSKAGDKYKSVKEELINHMREHGIERIRIVIDGNAKFYVLNFKEEIQEKTVEKVKKALEGDDE